MKGKHIDKTLLLLNKVQEDLRKRKYGWEGRVRGSIGYIKEIMLIQKEANEIRMKRWRLSLKIKDET